MELREYQRDCCNAIYKGWKEYRKLLAVLPTGAGKTICFSKLAKYYHEQHNERILILAHREELIQQAKDKLYDACGISAGIERAGDMDDGSSGIVIGSVQTVSGRLDRLQGPPFHKIIVDEAHHMLSETYLRIGDHFGEARFLGVTATPDRGDKKNLGRFFDDISYEIGLFDLIHQGYLCPIKVKTIPLNIDIRDAGYSHGDWQINALGNALDPYLEQIAEKLAALAAQGKKILVFLPLIVTSLKLEQFLKKLGAAACHIDGKDKQREQKLKDFRNGKIRIMCNAVLLNEGYDEPTVDCIAILRPTARRALYSQMVGRGTRISPGKECLTLLDFLWLHEKHNLMRPAHLISKDNELAGNITNALQPKFGFDEEAKDLERIHDDAVRKREEKLRRELAKKAKRRSRTLDALDIALQFGDHDLVDWEPTMQWHKDPVTKRQAEVLFRFGVDPSSVKGKGHANALLGMLFARSKKRLASPKAVKLMSRFGHPNAMAATASEAKSWLKTRLR